MFVEKLNLPENLKAEILKTEKMFSGIFQIQEVKDNMLILNDLETNKVYPTEISRQQNFKKGMVVLTKLHPWKDHFLVSGSQMILSEEDGEELEPDEETRRQVLHFLGIPTVEEAMAYYERSMKKEAESIQIALNSRISAILNKYPFQWVDGICASLGISVKMRKREKIWAIVDFLSSTSKLEKIINGLPKISLETINFVYKEGGRVQYGTLTRKFGSEENDSWWWNEKPPTSPIGQLRLRGLLVVGRVPMKGRMYKVVVIPKEVMVGLSAVLRNKQNVNKTKS